MLFGTIQLVVATHLKNISQDGNLLSTMMNINIFETTTQQFDGSRLWYLTVGTSQHWISRLTTQWSLQLVIAMPTFWHIAKRQSRMNHKKLILHIGQVFLVNSTGRLCINPKVNIHAKPEMQWNACQTQCCFIGGGVHSSSYWHHILCDFCEYLHVQMGWCNQEGVCTHLRLTWDTEQTKAPHDNHFVYDGYLQVHDKITFASKGFGHSLGFAGQESKFQGAFNNHWRFLFFNKAEYISGGKKFCGDS